MNTTTKKPTSPLGRVVHFCLHNGLVVGLMTLALVVWGLIVAPFDWDTGALPRDPIAVDAIPDIGENQQIVFTEWMGRSPQDVEDQITYPLTASLMGMPGVRTIRSFSYFGFSSIYIIFEDDVDFYWSRSRVLEKLNSLPAETLPDGAAPTLGPDATAVGQVFWYTLEGRDSDGNPTGGWDLHELRTAQDWYVRYALQGVEGVAEVASIGGYVQEYQVDVDPDAMRAYGVTISEVVAAVRMSNVDVGARTIEVNEVEYVVRGLGRIESIDDIENTVITSRNNVPIYVRNVANVSRGPALRRGALDKGGADAVGGVVVVRYGENPLATIGRIKEKIEEISRGLPSKTLDDGRVSRIAIVPFYDRTGLINETLGTLSRALYEEILVTIIVVLVMVMHFRASFLITGLLPLAVLMCFIAMRVFGVDANIVALSGIAIAIGTMVDMGIVVTENILKRLSGAGAGERRIDVIYRATVEVGGAVLTAVLTTVISFLPVFTMEAAEGKLFKPLAFTKTFALLASVLIALAVIPPLAHLLFRTRVRVLPLRLAAGAVVLTSGGWIALTYSVPIGALVGLIAITRGIQEIAAKSAERYTVAVISGAAAIAMALLLAESWMPLGPEQGFTNAIFVVGLVAAVLGTLAVFQRAYVPLLSWCLNHKVLFLTVPTALILAGASAWLGFAGLFGWAAKLPGLEGLPGRALWRSAETQFPGLGEEFMPPLDEGAFLFMPTTMPHASLGKSLDYLEKQDMAIRAIPEVDSVVGKIGRVDSSLDPAPISMMETVVNYKPEYVTDESGRRMRFRFDASQETYVRDEQGDLIPDSRGRPYRQWREDIRSPDDIWRAIEAAAAMPGTTPAPRLQPIAARLVMLQSGMRAPMGVKLYGPDLETLEGVGLEIERLLKQIPQVKAETVIADRVVGKPYLEIDIDREAIARYGLHIAQVQDVIEVAIGGRTVTETVEGRERYAVRVRYLRELRSDIESLERILVPAASGAQIPLGELARIYYRPGPQAVKSEDTFLVSYVIFDKHPRFSEVETVEACQRYLDEQIAQGTLVLPPGVNFRFSGNYENQLRSERRLLVVLPAALLAIFLILYLQFGRVSTTLLVFSGVVVAWAGGFLMLWLYGQDWFLDITVLGTNLRDLFQIRPVNLSIAVWVGFLALFGIATDNGVILATYLRQSFAETLPKTTAEIRAAAIDAARRRIRPCLMTSATTIIALIPVLSSTGRGADVMVPMAIPSIGGMVVVLISVFVVPVLYAAVEEQQAKGRTKTDTA